jgi:hemerythrin-like domain-containing protein
MTPRGQLMIEHRLIEKYLAFAGRTVAAMTEVTYDPLLLDAVVDFIRTYADRTHHGKEENILFEELSRKSMSPTDLAAMEALVREHEQAREAVGKLVGLNRRFKTGDRSVLPAIRELVGFLGTFYPSHIKREDTSFFRDTERYFSKEELVDMLAKFNAFDRDMIHEKYRTLLDTLGGR